MYNMYTYNHVCIYSRNIYFKSNDFIKFVIILVLYAEITYLVLF